MGDNTGDISREVNLFGKYEVGKIIGCGAFAKVYYGRNVRTGQSVAIKAVSKQKILRGGLTAHVKREISIMSRLQHPNIVKLYEVLATKAKIYFVMEFAKGGELFAKISKGRFSEQLSRRYFQQLISAVEYCHSRGVFHRDLKLENLLLDENWDLKISDFGLSAVKEQIRPDGMLHTLCGTPAYVAPEILAKNGYDGAKVDMWSCGVVLFVLNAGYLPFNDPNLMAMYRKIYKGEYRCPKWTSPDLKWFIGRLLDTDPATRITIDEILRDPWFKKDYKERKFRHEDFDLKDSVGCNVGSEKYLNAFDIISLSSGFNLSGLFDDFNNNDAPFCNERFLSNETPDKILEKVEEVARLVADGDRLAVTKKEWGAKLEGQNGNFTMVIGIDRLTDDLVVVEIKERMGRGKEKWKDKLRPLLGDLIYQPEATVAGVSQ